MAGTAIPEADYLSGGTEILRESSDQRAFAKLVALMSAGAVAAIAVTVWAGYQVIMSDPLVARHASGIGPALQTLVPFGREETLIAGGENDGTDLGADLNAIAPAAGPGVAPDE